MEWEHLGIATDWLCKSYITEHGDMDSDDRLEIYTGCKESDKALIAALQKVMGNALPDTFRAAVDELSELCDLATTGFIIPPDDAGLKLNYMLLSELTIAADVLLYLLDQCLPEEAETRAKLVKAQKDNEYTKEMYQRKEEKIKGNGDVFPKTSG